MDTQEKEETELKQPVTERSLGSILNLNQNGLPKETGLPQNTVSKPELKQRVNHTAADKQQLAIALSRICAVQHQYGKTQAELELLVEGLCWALAKFTMPQILDAIGQYILKKNDIPAPADIANIIDPPPVQLSPAVYVSLQKKAYSGVYLLKAEREYCENFRRQEMAKVRGGSDDLREAEREVQNYKLTYDQASSDYN